MHFYAGLCAGPFVFIAALTGFLFVITPQVETWLYRDALFTQSQGTPHSLLDQAQAGNSVLEQHLTLSAIRPAPYEGMTTRVMFSDPSLGDSENRTIFVDPVTLEVKGDLTTYGTTGTLPFRITLDYLHRNLMLGEFGRYYSELAASWLLIVALGGIAIWASGPPRRRAIKDMPLAQRRRWIHATLGSVLAIALILTALTGLTWSRAAGGNIDAFRNMVGWITPSVSTAVAGVATPVVPAEHLGHEGHGGTAMAGHDHDTMTPEQIAAMNKQDDLVIELDDVAQAARIAGIDSPYMEIRVPRNGAAWVVREYDRSWPTQVDTIALHPADYRVTSRADFAEFTLIPKLIRWGVDAHMGILFGWVNQLVMALLTLGLMVSTVYGYLIWWQRRPAAAAQTLYESFRLMSGTAQIAVSVVALALAYALPVMGLSLLAFCIIDILRSLKARQMAN